MAYSYHIYNGNGSTKSFPVPEGYVNQDEIKVFIDGVPYTAFTFTSASSLQLDTAPPVGTVVKIARITDLTERAVDFQGGSVLSEQDLDNALIQVFNASQEAVDRANDSISRDNNFNYDAGNRRVVNVAEPVADNDATTKSWVETGMSSQLAQATALVEQAQSLVNQADTIISSFTVSTADPSGGDEGDVWFKVFI